MGIKTDAYLGAALALVLLGVYVDRKYTQAGGASGIASNLAGVLWDNAAGAASSAGSAVWGTATAPITYLGPANGVATDMVDAPSNLLDAFSLGLISGNGGNSGSANLGSWLWNIVNGNAFAPSSSSTSDAGAMPVDFGNKNGLW